MCGRKSENIINLHKYAHTHTHMRHETLTTEKSPKWYGSIDGIYKNAKRNPNRCVCDPCCFSHSIHFTFLLHCPFALHSHIENKKTALPICFGDALKLLLLSIPSELVCLDDISSDTYPANWKWIFQSPFFFLSFLCVSVSASALCFTLNFSFFPFGSHRCVTGMLNIHILSGKYVCILLCIHYIHGDRLIIYACVEGVSTTIWMCHRRKTRKKKKTTTSREDIRKTFLLPAYPTTVRRQQQNAATTTETLTKLSACLLLQLMLGFFFAYLCRLSLLFVVVCYSPYLLITMLSTAFRFADTVFIFHLSNFFFRGGMLNCIRHGKFIGSA